MVGRRGNVLDTFLILMVLGAVSIAILFAFAFTNTLSEAFNQSEEIPSYAKDLSNSVNSQTPGILDFGFMMLFIGLPLIGMALAFFVDTHPIIFWASLGLVVLIIVFAGGVAVAWEQLTTTNNFLGAAANKLPMTNFVMSNFPVYAFLAFGIIAFGTFIKARSGGYYG